VEYGNQESYQGENMIKKLNSNGYAYYRELEYWKPLDASAVICGLDPETIDYSNMPSNVKHVYRLIESMFHKGMLETKRILISNEDECTFLDQYSSSFFYYDINEGILHYIYGIELIHCLKYKMEIEIPSELELINDIDIPF
jgi:hypothetical protein